MEVLQMASVFYDGDVGLAYSVDLYDVAFAVASSGIFPC
jgi:hypothetical protein